MDRTLVTGSRRGRRLGLLSATGAGLALVVAACAGSTATPTPAPPADAAAVVSRAVAAPMDKLKIDVGLTTTGDSAVTIDPKSIELVVDTKAGKGTFHLSLPKSALGSDASALPIAGDTIDLDVLFDGQAIYAKSPLAATLLPLLLSQSGTQVPGDLTGWLKLGTAEELGGLLGSLGAGASASPSQMPAMASMTPDQLKQELEQAGITVTLVGTEQHNGTNMDHVTIAVDPSKVADSDIGKQVPAGQLGTLKDLAGAGTLSGDLWFDHASGRIAEADINAVDKNGAQNAKVTILVSDPGNVSFDAPPNAVEVPITPLLQTLMTLGGGLIPGASANP